ncbi:phenol hydroxylase [Corynebacterium sp. ES2794-CONJ1]|uniref:phenol hydroxylase n=1 Tax=unclassified Corynebacterium TaxID=2624378 RepID=UPI002168614B|nr:MULTISPECIES: phenol hydroxylase [unclassified Corynebacterium]MCS4490215.1 phenol hydroxylase [Corynebacterium sp. ES2775-CONJ]MCS4491974.1 phenol hydroxylase [Corynebacterium sp. ES2715-CONJ3]MCS4532078.1 phenol hydroxylase [Corynebacterium sp. ES2730-CONJ]MCU9519480.1 phenol hydroxylase [Corynebacterium sp. ES2794-CONJ1]
MTHTEQNSPQIVPENIQDEWLEETSHHRSVYQEFWHDYINYPKALIQHGWSFLKTTPGRMTALMLVLSIVVVGTGMFMSQSAAQRRSDLDHLITTTEPVSYLAQSLYSNLAAANTAASSGFVLAGVDSNSNRDDYQLAYQQAARDIAVTANGITDPTGEEMRLITRLSEHLPIYTGLVETAWANNRQGNPVGVAYMSEASTLMREHMLPNAARLYALTSENVHQQQTTLTQPLWIPLIGLLVALIALILTQLWLSSVSNRRLNRGMVAATFLLLIANAWVISSAALTFQAGNQSYTQASQPLSEVIEARIAAQQTRGSEMLALVWRQSLVNSTKNFDTTISDINATLDLFPQSKSSDAHELLDRWSRSHQQLVTLLNAGDYDQAQKLTAAASSSHPYQELDTALATLIDDSRSQMRDYINRGIAASASVSAVTLVLSLLAVVSIWMGIRPRLQEYL